MQAELLVRTGSSPDRRLPVLDGSATLIGRAVACSIILDHHDVAPVHCLLAPCPDHDGFTLIDAWTQAGTRVNGEPFHKGLVGLGDIIGIGPFELELAAAEDPGAAAPGDAAGEPLFEFRSRRDGSAVFALAAGSCVVVGRDPRADVQLDDPYVSEFHLVAALAAAGDEWVPMVADLRSSNGTCVNGRPIHRAHALPGSVVTVGRAGLTVCRTGADDEAAGVPDRARRTTEVLFPGEPGSRLVAAPQGTPPIDAAGYASYYGFQHPPFRLTADPDCFFRSRSHVGALGELLGWLRRGHPIGVLHGPAGTGKSLLLACVVRELAYRNPAPVVVRPGLEDWTADELIAATLARAAALHGEFPAADQTPLERWHAEIDELRQRNVLVALVVDDADTVGRGFVDRLAELLATRPARVATRVLLVGRGDVLRLAESDALAPLTGIRCEMAPLEPDEVGAYIGHRLLDASGRRERLFTRQAVDLIAMYTGGVPRLVNIVADAALFTAWRADRHSIDHHIVADAIRDALDPDALTP